MMRWATAFFVYPVPRLEGDLQIMILSTLHLILFCLAALVAVAIGVAIHERRRQRGLTEILRRIVRRRSHHHADDFPF